jgi:polyisoprenoid-binding protein YceI
MTSISTDTPSADQGPPAPSQGTWHLDPLHSTVGFVARHLGFVRVRGRFTDVAGVIRIAEPVEESTAEVRIATATIDTGVPVRDRHLRTAEFLDSERHPLIEFQGTRVRRESGSWLMDGELTIAGNTRPVTLTGEFLGEDVYPFTGSRRLGFTGRARVDRRDFGVTGLPPGPAGTIFVGAEVDIELEVSATEDDNRAMTEEVLGRRLAL